jgi:conjugative relaxase-like TrwC/TraI family protein
MSVSADKMEPIDRYLRRYQKNGDQPARWIGDGPKQLGFDGTATPDALRNVSRNRTPDGKKMLVYPPNRISIPADSHKQTTGWCFSFRVPHEVSVAWGTGPDDLAARIQEACFNATNKTIEFAEKHAAWVRVGHMKYHRAKLIAAVIPQTVSDALGPELRMHCLIAPAGVGPDGVVRPLNGRPLFRHKMAFDAMFRATLAHDLHEMGFRCAPVENSFKVDGIPEKLCEHFAKRRPIDAGLSGKPDHRSNADINVLLARDLAASYGQGPKHLRELWRIEAARLGVTPDTISDATRPSFMTRFQRFVGIRPQASTHAPEQTSTPDEGTTTPSPEVGQILRQSFDTWYVRQAVDRRHNATEFVRHALDTSIGSGADPQRVLREIDLWAANELSWPQASKRQADLKMSQRDIAFLVRQMRDDRGHVLHDAVIRKVMGMYSAPPGPQHGLPVQEKADRGSHKSSPNRLAVHDSASTLNKEGQSLVVTLTRQRGRVVVVSHRHTQQRELALGAAATAWRAAGYEVTAVTPDRRAAEQLEQSTGIASIPRSQLQLVQGSVSSSRPYSPLQQGNHVEAMFANHVNKDRNHVLVVDQAHRLSLDDLKRLVSHTKEHGGKLVLLTPHIDELPGGRTNMSAVLLNALSERRSEIIGRQSSIAPRQHVPPPEQPRQQGMEMS